MPAGVTERQAIAKPAAIRRFELLLGIGLGIDIVNNVANVIKTGPRPLSPVISIVLAMTPFLVGLAFWYAVSRRRSNTARWVIAVLVAVASIGLGAKIAAYGAVNLPPLLLVAALSEVFKIAAVACLFSKSARPWFPTRQ